MRWRRVLGVAAGAPVVAAAALAGHDVVQRKHAVLRNYPVIGHARYLIERIGPELRQYIVAGNDEERPFSRDERRWIYASSKGENNRFGFGTDNNLDTETNYPIIKQRTFSTVQPREADPSALLPSAKILGGPRGRAKAFRPASLINVSGMSFGALSGNAIAALNEGVKIADALHNTGEGGLSPYHRRGGELIFQIGTAYFGCRDARGSFDLERLVDLVASAPVRAVEIKLSQGAKPGLGGLLPGAKVSAEIAQIRGIPQGVDCVSPSRHTAFGSVDELLDFAELIAERTGLPVGAKTAVGNDDFFTELVRLSEPRDRGLDFLTIDGGEGGTGAAPLVFADSVSLPFRIGFPRVYRAFAEAGLTDTITFIGAGRLGLPENAMVAFALGCDMINVAREAMLAIGCIQSQKCHTDRCPTGVATQNPWLAHGLDPELKSHRLAGYVRTFRGELLELSEAIGVAHPALIDTDDIELLAGDDHAITLRERYGYLPGWGLPSAADRAAILELMASAHAEADERIPIAGRGGNDGTDQHHQHTDEEP